MSACYADTMLSYIEIYADGYTVARMNSKLHIHRDNAYKLH